MKAEAAGSSAALWLRGPCQEFGCDGTLAAVPPGVQVVPGAACEEPQKPREEP